jgi:hypothetical protein
MARHELRDRPADRQRIAQAHADTTGTQLDDDSGVVPTERVLADASDFGGLPQWEDAEQFKVRPKLGLSVREHFFSPHRAKARHSEK